MTHDMCKNHIKYNPTGLHLEEKKERKKNSNYHEHGFKFIAVDKGLRTARQSAPE
jgi:hypothetical protein